MLSFCIRFWDQLIVVTVWNTGKTGDINLWCRRLYLKTATTFWIKQALLRPILRMLQGIFCNELLPFCIPSFRVFSLCWKEFIVESTPQSSYGIISGLVIEEVVISLVWCVRIMTGVLNTNWCSFILKLWINWVNLFRINDDPLCITVRHLLLQ